MTTTEDFFADIKRRHYESVARGEHDDQCEWRPGFYLCHCSKRRREAAGYTEPPGELIYQAPLCPRCYKETAHNGDGFACEPCRVTWDSDGVTATFTDDYGRPEAA
jgi:hypothetical protein